MVDQIQAKAEPSRSEYKALTPYMPLFVTPLGLALIVFITRRFFPGSQGSGIPQSIAAIALSNHDERKKVLSLRIVLITGSN